MVPITSGLTPPHASSLPKYAGECEGLAPHSGAQNRALRPAPEDPA
ncbi:hypothetical protein IMCC21224_113272 [Puniceibacterium sp. IMCC21224]|nr:hypothetical protein IMCC21224_113272 [Puniceibacterium sp. IMCC21224]